jgi:hypothetical protein
MDEEGARNFSKAVSARIKRTNVWLTLSPQKWATQPTVGHIASCYFIIYKYWASANE